jgi:hypothetical protein
LFKQAGYKHESKAILQASVESLDRKESFCPDSRGEQINYVPNRRHAAEMSALQDGCGKV